MALPYPIIVQKWDSMGNVGSQQYHPCNCRLFGGFDPTYEFVILCSVPQESSNTKFETIGRAYVYLIGRLVECEFCAAKDAYVRSPWQLQVGHQLPRSLLCQTLSAKTPCVLRAHPHKVDLSKVRGEGRTVCIPAIPPR
jgi:hypothetical protein